MFQYFGWSTDPVEPTPRQIIEHLEKDRIEREIALHEAIEARKAAYQMAVAKERLTWIAAGGLLTIGISIASAYLHRNIVYTLSIPAITTGFAYETHRCYGNKSKMIQKIAENIQDDAAGSTFYSLRRTTVGEVDARIREESDC